MTALIYGAVHPWIGTQMHGYCGGFFGDRYGSKTIVLVGPDWLVAIENGRPCTAQYPSHEYMVSEYKEHSEKPDIMCNDCNEVLCECD